MKIWETECFVLNFNTGELTRCITEHYFQGVNFEQAQLSLIRSKSPTLRLTGKWFIDKSQVEKPLEIGSNKEAEDLNTAYESMIDPRELTKDMSLDDFIDWLDISDELKDVLAALKAFRKASMSEHVKVIIGHLKHKYNYDEENQEGLQLPD